MPQVMSKDGTVIAYDKVGSGPTLVMVNGALGYRQNWGEASLATQLSEDFTVIMYDRRGRGESGDTQPYAVDREVEDIEVLIDDVGASAYLYGFSAGAVLALRAAATLGAKVRKLVVHAAPSGVGGAEEAEAFSVYKQHMQLLIEADRRSDALELFFADMLPPEVLDKLRTSPEWVKLEVVAPTLVYDNAVLGDGLLPVADAAAITVPTLVLDSTESPPFIQEAADALANELQRPERRTLEGGHRPEPEILALVLVSFLRR